MDTDSGGGGGGGGAVRACAWGRERSFGGKKETQYFKQKGLKK